MSFPFPLPRILLLAASLLLASALQGQPVERNYSPTDDTAEGLIKYKEAMDAKNFVQAHTVIDELMRKVSADSYDAALLHQYRLQIFLQTGEYAKAIEPMERSLQLSESKTPTYFDERITRELYYYLVQLYFQEANQTKNATLAASHMDKAANYMESWRKITPETNADAQMLFAQLLISRALLNPEKPDLAMVKRALDEVETGILLTTRPRDTFYVLKLVCLQQMERHAEAAELFELLLKKKPANANYWQQLAGIYLNLSQEIRAVATIERAQSHGFMNLPRDHFNLVGIYFNLGQYGKAAELLETGLKDGLIENEPKNWELLALSYQQLQRPLKGIEALKQGAKSFPESGQLEFLIAQGYTAIEKPAEALPHIQAAVAKGNLTRPYQAHLSLAYTAYSLQKYDMALAAARKAAEFPEGTKDAKSMIRALEEIIRDREAKKNDN